MYTAYYSSRMCFKNIFINTILKITKWYVVLKDMSVCPLLQDAHAEHQGHHGQHPLRDVPRAPAKRVQRSLELSPARASTCSAQGQRSAPTASGRRRASQRSGNPTSSSHSWDVDAHPYARSVYMNRPVDTRVLRARISFPSGTFFPARNNFSIAIIHVRIHSLSFTYNRIWCRDTTGVGGGTGSQWEHLIPPSNHSHFLDGSCEFGCRVRWNEHARWLWARRRGFERSPALSQSQSKCK